MNNQDYSQLIEKTVPRLLDFGDPALAFFTRRELIGEDPDVHLNLKALPALQRIFAKQRPDGAWP